MAIAISIQEPQWGVNYGPGFNCFTVRRGDFVSRGIQWFTRWEDVANIPVSHTFPVCGPDYTIEAFGNGVHPGTLSAYLDDPNVALLVRRPRGWDPDLGARMVAEAKRHIGRGYDYKLIAGMAVSNMFVGKGLDWLTHGRFSELVDKWADTRSREICSEMMALVDQAMPELARLGILANKKAWQIDPAGLFNSEAVFEPGAIELVRDVKNPAVPFS